MISTIEIYKAIRDELETLFPNILVQQKDIKNITRPSFYIQYVGKNLEQQAQEYFEDRISYNIIYFAQNEELLELLEIEETILKAFKDPLIINDDTKVIEVQKDALTSNLNEEDYYINFTIDFVLNQHMANDDTGLDMLAVGVKVKNSNDGEIYAEDGTEENMEDIN